MRAIGLTDDLYTYVLEHSNPTSDPVSEQLAETTRERFGGLSAMNIGEDQGRFLQLLTSVTGTRLAVEVGTFTGMSALWIARGLPAGGRLLCFELSEDYLDTAQEAWAAAGVADRIEMRIGPAAERLAELPAEPHIDLAFIDADKAGYATYLDVLLPRVKDDGVILVDNVLWSGRVIDPEDTADDTAAIRNFNDDVAQRDDLNAVMLAIGDGITMITPRR